MRIAVCISGYFGSTADPSSDGAKGFEYIKRELLQSYEADVFIHTWDKSRASEIYELYSPWIKKFSVESQKTFENEMAKVGGDWSNSPCAKLPFLSQAYGRQKSLNLRSEYEKENNFKYDWVIYCRFDLGVRDLHADPRYRCCEIDFYSELDPNLFYSKYWNQFNQGFADMWFYSSSENMDIYAKYYDFIFKEMQPNSEYFKNMESGWFDSNLDDEFSNEMYKENKAVQRWKYPTSWCRGNNHSFHKWFFKQNGLYDKCIEGAWQCRVR